MDEATKRAREQRALAQDFFAANPGQQYLAMGGMVYQPGGRVTQQPAEGVDPNRDKGSKT